MSKEARKKRLMRSLAVVTKLRELAEVIAREEYGPLGVPIDITFTEIEQIGHLAGQMVAAEVDQKLTAEHQEYFVDELHPCPKCGRLWLAKPCERDLKTRDGTMMLPETVCDCLDCRRSFFPSAYSVET
jgi:hypothetical protein